MRLRIRRLFFEIYRVVVGVELHHAVAFGVGHVIGEHASAAFLLHRAAQSLFYLMAVENIVTQNQADTAVADKVFANNKRLREPFGLGLLCIAQRNTPARTVAKQLLKRGGVLGSSNDKYVADTRLHQGRQRVVDHWLVVHRHQLLGRREGHRVEAASTAAGQYYSFGHKLLCVAPKLVLALAGYWGGCAGNGERVARLFITVLTS